MHFNDGIVEFGFDCKARKLSDKSISNYQKQLRYLLRYLEAEFQVNQVEEVRSFHIKQFLVDMADKGRKPQYINDLLKVFKTFFNYMKKEGYIKERPTAIIHNMKQPKVKIITFSEDEIRKMLHYYQGRNFLNIRNRTMIALFFDTGMRLTEVMTLRPEQIREDSIIVHGKGNKERLVPVSAYLAKALMQYQMVREAYFEAKLPERYLFVSKNGRKLTQEAITKVLKKAATDVGVNRNVRVSPHTCRHTFAHLQLKNGLLKAFKTFFNYLKREGHIKENPTTKVKNMKQPKTKILTFSEDEIRRLLNHFNGKSFLDIRNRAILAMFFDTGMRLTEVITLKPEQIHDEYILVHGKGSKERLVPVSPYLAKTLMKYRMAREAYFEDKLPEPYVFLSNRGKKLTQEAIAKFFNSYLMLPLFLNGI